MAKHPRYPVGDGKYCYSGPDCKLHGWRTPQLVKETTEASKKAVAAYLDYIHENSKNVSSAEELGETALFKGLGAYYCEEHHTYHVYSLEAANSTNVRLHISDAIQPQITAILNSSIERKSPVLKDWSEDVRKTARAELSGLMKQNRSNMVALQAEFRSNPSDPEVLLDAIAARAEQYEQDRERSGVYRVPKPKGPVVPLRPEPNVNDSQLLKYWQCGRKRAFNSSESVNAFLGSQSDHELNAYHCRHCSQWHMGHGTGNSPVDEQLERARVHWVRYPDKVNQFVIAEGL